MMRIVARKNLSLLRRNGESAIDRTAGAVRSRFATDDKHQIYADKREEARRYLKAVQDGEQTGEADYPYLYAEVGITAATLADLANLWISLNNSWRSVSASIEKITLRAKKQIREASGQAAIDLIVSQTSSELDTIGDKPPEPPGKDKNKPNPKPKPI